MLKVFGVLALLVAVFVAFQVYQAYQVLTAPPRKPAVDTSPEAAKSFDQKVGAVATAVASGGKQPVNLTLSEQEISSKVQESLASRGVRDLRDVAVKLGDGTATVHATTTLGGMNVPVEANVQLGASGGLLTVNVTSLKAADLGLPASLQQQLTEQVKQATGLRDLQSIDVGIDVKSVQVANGRLQVEGQTR